MTATSLGANGAHLDAESCCIARALIRLGCAALAAQGQRRPPGTAGLLAALDPAADLAYDVAMSPSVSSSVSSVPVDDPEVASSDLDTGSVARILGVSRRQVNRLVANGELRGSGSGRGAVQKIEAASVDAYRLRRRDADRP